MSEDAGAEQRRLPFVLMRGGTSKGVFLDQDDLPPPGDARDEVILALFGSPDPRQIDGIGGADLLTSKLAIIGKPTRSDADLDYTFAQVSVTEAVVDYDINCGNVSSAVGAFAVDTGRVTVTEPMTTVRIHNTNTARVLLVDVPIRNGRAAIAGPFAIDGVPGTGARIDLDYSRTAGGSTGSLLPTGNVSDVLEVDFGPVTATIVDLAMLSVYFGAEAVGLSGIEGPGEMTAAHLDKIALVKDAAAKRLGMATDGLVPVPVVVSRPADYRSFATGAAVAASEMDLVARVIGGRPPVVHKAYPGTVSVCTGVAASIPGTIPHQVATQRRDGELVIGHPSGVMPVQVSVSPSGEDWSVEKAAYGRTARRLAEGTAFIRSAAGADQPTQG